MTIEQLCEEKSMRMTDQRRVIAKILDSADDHPDVEELHNRACLIDKNISVATVYRTVRLFEEAGILVSRHSWVRTDRPSVRALWKTKSDKKEFKINAN